ncbi:molybdopterin molybdotransferase MoeA [Luteococcus sediminum]
MPLADPHAAMDIEQHRQRVSALATALPTVELPLLECAGLRLASDVQARVGVPAFDSSAMDGFALRLDDLGTLPCCLPVHGEIPAGHRPVAPPPGAAVRIMTGARVPTECDVVVPVEATDARPGEGPVPQQVTIDSWDGRLHIRPSGEDLPAGATVLRAGTLLDATHLAAAAATGHEVLPARRRARVLVVTTGDELAAPGSALGCAQIPDSNSVLVAATVPQLGGQVLAVRHAGDTVGQLDEALASCPEAPDLVVTTGGVSVGSHDVLQSWAAHSPSARVELGHVAIQPGRPQGWGHVRIQGRMVPLVALPGNPVAVHVGLHLFVRAVLDRLAGIDDSRRVVQVAADEDFATRPGRTRIVDVVLDGGRARSAPGGHGSHRIGTLHRADGLAVVTGPIARGERVPVLLTR